MDVETFQKLPMEEIVQLVCEAGKKVCVFPTNGTRRWFMLEHDVERWSDAEFFVERMAQKHIELYALCFDHGIGTLLTPIFGPDIMERDDGGITARAMSLLTQSPFLDFYKEYQIRVRFYGDYQRLFASTPYAYLLEQFDAVTEETLSHHSYRLFYGICAHDATETVAKIGIQFYLEQGRPPDRREIIEQYYGEYIEPVDFFIGFDRPAAFDMPLISTGSEDLYFTVSPSPYMDAHTLRSILHDHLYARQIDESSYAKFSSEEWDLMRDFYTANLRQVIGVGKKSGGIWYPLPQVSFPDSFNGVI